MALDFVDIALVEIDGKEMETVKSISVDTTLTKNPVNTMNAQRIAKGVTAGVRSYPVKITAAMLLGDQEVDWYGWCERNEAHTIVYEQGQDGKRIHLIDVFINSVSEKHDEGGESMLDIDAIALDRRED